MNMIKPFGKIYGGKDTPSFITPDGISVWMWRNGVRVRFYSADGIQIGPEHSNVAPAMLSAYAAGWMDPSVPAWLNEGCINEVRRNGKPL